LEFTKEAAQLDLVASSISGGGKDEKV